ncbi:MAG TPA: ATP-dependent DNA helicase RecG [Candidatus Paceibacterota bacterium]|nr:ATP-dependent DNA helicase RecG [Candidatus Paceibacterota bacterium]HRZ34338.1 ATP-dependent DNA helicase RecG [Candidatus Paceibacterota bacterium]
MNLTDKVEDTFRLLSPQKKALAKLGIETVADVLFHFPHRYGENFEQATIAELDFGKKVTIYGRLKSLDTGKTFRGRRPIAKATISDDNGSAKLIWFSQPYIAKMFHEGELVRIEGTVSKKKSGDLFSIPNPQIERVQNIPEIGEKNSLFSNVSTAESGALPLHPIYSESHGITSNWFFHAVSKILKSGVLEKIKDPIPPEILQKYNLPSLKTSLIWIHAPKRLADAISARKRFAFEEIFYIQLQKQKQRTEIKKSKAFKIPTGADEVKTFTDKYPFDLTSAQEKAIATILADLKRDFPMSRLLEGDVGSGKTAVAAAAVYAVIKCAPKGRSSGRLQVAYMVPTEILAKQHFENFVRYFVGSGIQVGLITGSACYKFPSKIKPREATKISRSQLAKWVENGEIPIVVGTHALISKSVKFKHLGLVIIDEQHRFGTRQRKNLAQKDEATPHLLSMTATPIPRTLSLTVYGDLDLTLLDQMPAGRKPIITEIVLPNEREKVYQKIHKEIKSGRQAFIICPRIEEPDSTKIGALYAKSVKAEAKRLREKVFPDLEIAEIHGKMKPADKEKVMKDFENGEIDVLVSTSVVEVGVNVPNATIIVIEGAERFGLAQLHQLRGRVWRSNYQSYCFIFTDSPKPDSIKRLRAIQTAKNGFELAELDLQIRGAGELTGAKQWGISDVGMEAIKNVKMVEAAQKEAQEIIEKDPELKSAPELAKEISERDKIHFE